MPTKAGHGVDGRGRAARANDDKFAVGEEKDGGLAFSPNDCPGENGRPQGDDKGISPPTTFPHSAKTVGSLPHRPDVDKGSVWKEAAPSATDHFHVLPLEAEAKEVFRRLKGGAQMGERRRARAVDVTAHVKHCKGQRASLEDGQVVRRAHFPRVAVSGGEDQSAPKVPLGPTQFEREHHVFVGDEWIVRGVFKVVEAARWAELFVHPT